jgi:large subunit ribosomal protein L25
MKDIQFHRVTDKIIHVDFLEVIPGKAVVIEIPVKTTGTASGVRAGGKLLKKLRSLTAKGAADKFPEAITLNVEKMEIGDSVRVRDIKLEGITFSNNPNATVIAVRITRNVAEEEATTAAGAATPAAGAAATSAAGGAAPAAGAKAPAAAGAKEAPKKEDGKKDPAAKKK